MVDFAEVIDKYVDEAEDDFNFDKADLEAKLRSIPNLHSKWLRYFMKQSKVLLQKERDLRDLERTKRKYYLYDYDYEVKPTQVQFYIDSDEDYSKKLYQVNLQRKLVDLIERNLKKTTQLSFDLKNLIDFKKMKEGIN
jgi:hypothetical protein